MNIWRITGRKGWKRLDYRNEWKYQLSGAQLAVLAARLSPIPVSYTHLDVYKRQAFMSITRPLPTRNPY